MLLHLSNHIVNLSEVNLLHPRNINHHIIFAVSHTGLLLCFIPLYNKNIDETFSR